MGFFKNLDKGSLSLGIGIGIVFMVVYNLVVN